MLMLKQVRDMVLKRVIERNFLYAAQCEIRADAGDIHRYLSWRIRQILSPVAQDTRLHEKAAQPVTSSRKWEVRKLLHGEYFFSSEAENSLLYLSLS
jgi:hypothetical protein